MRMGHQGIQKGLSSRLQSGHRWHPEWRGRFLLSDPWHGVLDGLWTKVGKSKDLGDLDKMVFRTYVERVPGILASHWFVWKANHNLKEYKTLPRRYRKVDYGGVMPPSHVVERIRTGRWFKVQNVYDDYDSYLTKWGCERISVPFLRQQRKDWIKSPFS